MDTLEKERPVRDQMLVFGAPVIGEEEIAEVVATLRSGWIGTGPRAARFEQASLNKLVEIWAISSCLEGSKFTLTPMPRMQLLTPSPTMTFRPAHVSPSSK